MEIKLVKIKNISAIGWCAIFIGVFSLYLLTLAPDLVWQDQGDYQYQSAKLILNIPGDVVRIHPLYMLVSHYLGKTGLFSYAYAANLVSALFTAITVANVYLLIFLLTESGLSAVLASLVFAFAHTVWFLGVQAQTYGMANAALSASYILAVYYIFTNKIRYLFGMGLISGLGISIHMMSQIGFAVLMVWIFIRLLRRKISFVQFLTIIALWCVGAMLYWVVIVMEYCRSGDLIGTLSSAIWGRWANAVFNISNAIILLKRSVLYFILNFPTPLVFFTIPGLYCSFKKIENKAVSWILLISLIMYIIFAMRYNVPNQNNFFLPAYMLVSVYMGIGIAYAIKKLTKIKIVILAAMLLLIPLSYLGISKYASWKKINLGVSHRIPYRNVYEYYLLPWQQNQNGPKRLVTEVFEKLPPKAILMVDSTPFSVFIYAQQIEGMRPDIELVEGDNLTEQLMVKISAGQRLFNLYGINDCPKWVKADWLKPLAISNEENIYEIIFPKNE